MAVGWTVAGNYASRSSFPGTPNTIVDGLWGNVQDAVVADFATVAWRMKLLGFNTIRLPFSFQAFGQAPRARRGRRL